MSLRFDRLWLAVCHETPEARDGQCGLFRRHGFVTDDDRRRVLPGKTQRLRNRRPRDGHRLPDVTHTFFLIVLPMDVEVDTSILLVRCQDLTFGLCATASQSSETVFSFIEAIQEHWVAENGHPVAREYFDWTTYLWK